MKFYVHIFGLVKPEPLVFNNYFISCINGNIYKNTIINNNIINNNNNKHKNISHKPFIFPFSLFLPDTFFPHHSRRRSRSDPVVPYTGETPLALLDPQPAWAQPEPAPFDAHQLGLLTRTSRSLATCCRTAPPEARLSSFRHHGAPLGPNYPRSAVVEEGSARVTLTRDDLPSTPRLSYGQAVAPLCRPSWAHFELNSAKKWAEILSTFQIVCYRKLVKKPIFVLVSFFEVRGYHWQATNLSNA